MKVRRVRWLIYFAWLATASLRSAECKIGPSLGNVKYDGDLAATIDLGEVPVDPKFPLKLSHHLALGPDGNLESTWEIPALRTYVKRVGEHGFVWIGLSGLQHVFHESEVKSYFSGNTSLRRLPSGEMEVLLRGVATYRYRGGSLVRIVSASGNDYSVRCAGVDVEEISTNAGRSLVKVQRMAQGAVGEVVLPTGTWSMQYALSDIGSPQLVAVKGPTGGITQINYEGRLVCSITVDDRKASYRWKARKLDGDLGFIRGGYELELAADDLSTYNTWLARMGIILRRKRIDGHVEEMYINYFRRERVISLDGVQIKTEAFDENE